MRKLNAKTVLLLALLSVPSFAAEPPARGQAALTFQTVLDSLQVRFRRIRDYRVRVHVVVDMRGLRIPPMQATVYFKQPDRLHIAADRFAMLPRHAIMFTPGLIRELIAKGRVLEQGVDANGLFRVKVKLRRKGDRPGGVLTLWFDLNAWVVKKMRVENASYGWMEVENEYGRVGGGFYLPVRSRVKVDLNMASLPRPGKGARHKLQRKFLQEVSGKGMVYVTYLDYRINQGIPDGVFRRRP